jgi:hypothetical protein
VVAGKVHFANNAKEIEEFIPAKQLLKEMDGEENWDYEYVEPVPGENDIMKDVEARDRLLAEREELFKEFEKLTLQWIQSPESEKGQEIKTQRNALAAKTREHYWKLDPYIRARSWYDRTGVILGDGRLDYYPKAKEEMVPPTANGAPVAAAETTPVVAPEPAPAPAPAAETSTDDVD